MMPGALDDAHALGFQAGTDLGSVAGDVTFPFGPHESVTDPPAVGDLQKGRIGLRVIGEAL
jgi:hypothetical protein